MAETQPNDATNESFVVGMDRYTLWQATKNLSPEQRVDFWRTFQPTIELLYPEAATNNTFDDIAAVVAGTKDAAIIDPNDPRIYRTNMVDRLLGLAAHEDGQPTLVQASTTDGYGNPKVFLGKRENVEALVRLYEGKRIGHDEASHRAIGQALGYPPEAIDDFIKNHVRQEGLFQKLGKLLTRR